MYDDNEVLERAPDAQKKPKLRRSSLPQEAGSGDVTPPPGAPGMKHGGAVGSASKRADGCAQRGKTRGKFV